MSILCQSCGTSYIYSGQCNCSNTKQQELLSRMVNPQITTHQYYIPDEIPLGKPIQLSCTTQSIPSSHQSDRSTSSTSSTIETQQRLSYQIQRFDTESISTLPNYTHDTSNPYYTNELVDFIPNSSRSCGPPHVSLNSINLANSDDISYMSSVSSFQHHLNQLNFAISQHKVMYDALQKKLFELQSTHQYILHQHQSSSHQNDAHINNNTHSNNHNSSKNDLKDSRNANTLNSSHIQLPPSLQQIIVMITTVQQELYDIQLKIQILIQRIILDQQQFENQFPTVASKNTNNLPSLSQSDAGNNNGTKDDDTKASNQFSKSSTATLTSWLSLEQYNNDTQRYIIAGVSLVIYAGLFLLSKCASTSSPSSSTTSPLSSPPTTISADRFSSSSTSNAPSISVAISNNTLNDSQWYMTWASPFMSLFYPSTLLHQERQLELEPTKFFDTSGGSYRLSTGQGVVIAAESTLDEVGDTVSDYVSDHLGNAI